MKYYEVKKGSKSRENYYKKVIKNFEIYTLIFKLKCPRCFDDIHRARIYQTADNTIKESSKSRKNNSKKTLDIVKSIP